MEHIPSSNSRWDLESLESRVLLSLACEADLQSAAAKGGGATALAIRLDLVALHELGHSLGLDHDTSETVSIMDPYYNDKYDIHYFLSGQDPAVAKLRALYADVNTSGWKDSLDARPGDGVIELTYSFVPDGTRMDKGSSTTSKTFDTLYGNSAAWQTIIAEQLHQWEDVSGGKLSFTQVSDSGAAFNTRGKAQNDPQFGDIRIGAHRFDGPAKTLAHAYYPPPNGATAAGDLHLDEAENWDGMQSVTAAKQTEKADQAETADEPVMFVQQAVVATNGGARVGASLFAGRAESVFDRAEDIF